jgi:hypothetical protein
VHNAAEVSSFAVPAIILRVLPSTKMVPPAKKTAPSGRRSRGDPMFPKIPHRLWLLLLPYIGLLWVPFYNFREPTLFGIPFFYWYQLAWVPVSALLTWLAYRTYSHED